MPRLAPLDPAQYTPEQREVADAIAGGPRGGVRGPFPPWLRSPVLADRAQRLGEYCRYDNSLPNDLSEMVIIMTARHWDTQYEFVQHAKAARAAKLPEEIIEAIRTGQEPPFTRDEERAIYAFVTEYFQNHRVSDDTYQRVVDLYGERGAVDLVGIVGYYCLVSMTLNVFEIPVPEGTEPPFAE